MTTFLIAFGALLVIMCGMAIGVMFKRKPIAGSCGGLNAISDADHCLVCGTPVDKDSPLKERLGTCPNKAKKEAALKAAQAEANA